MTVPEIFADIIDNLRSTGTITDLSESGGSTTVTSVNSLSANEVVTMDLVNYVVSSATSNEFVVTGTGLTATTWKAKAPYYEYGHPIEIFNTLTEKDKNEDFKYQKYPLIVLVLDYEEKNNTYTNNIENLSLIIMTETRRTFKAENRYDEIFTPILQPLYDSLIKYIKKSKYVSDELYEHKKIDRLYWGKQDEFGNMGKIGNDALDAIIISELNLLKTDC